MNTGEGLWCNLVTINYIITYLNKRFVAINTMIGVFFLPLNDPMRAALRIILLIDLMTLINDRK